MIMAHKIQMFAAKAICDGRKLNPLQRDLFLFFTQDVLRFEAIGTSVRNPQVNSLISTNKNLEGYFKNNTTRNFLYDENKQDVYVQFFISRETTTPLNFVFKDLKKAKILLQKAGDRDGILVDIPYMIINNMVYYQVKLTEDSCKKKSSHNILMNNIKYLNMNSWIRSRKLT